MITSLQGAPIPASDAVVNPDRKLTRPWSNFLTEMLNVLNLASTRARGSQLVGQNANVAATELTDGTFPAGLYELVYYARITTAATTGAATSSLTVTFRWTDGGVAQSLAGAAMTGNTTATWQGLTVPIYTDAASPVTFETAYVSDTAGEMEYAIRVFLRRCWT